jgi:hypothetical protein
MAINLSRLSKVNVMDIPFSEDFLPNSKKNSDSYRVTDAEMMNIPSDDENNTKSRQIIAMLFHEKTNGSYIKLEALTQIKQDTFRRWLKGTRIGSRISLAKFTVGLGVDIGIAEELFRLSGHPLDCENNRLDFITACAIRDKDDIEQFGNDIKKYCGGISIF